MSKAGNSNRVVRIVTLPYRALLKARDFYVKRITECGKPQVYTKPMFGGLGSISQGGSRSSSSSSAGLPRSFSAQSYNSADSDDLRELIRANSSNNHMDITKAELEQFIQQHLRQQRESVAKSASKGVPRSVSVGMARIDEEAESYDEDSVKGSRKADKLASYPRSKSYAVTNNQFAAHV